MIQAEAIQAPKAEFYRMVISLSDLEIDLILPLKHRDSCFISTFDFLVTKTVYCPLVGNTCVTVST